MENRQPDILLSAATELGISLSDEDLNLFNIYYEELLKWNEKINLVSVKSPQDIWIKHFIDSLTALPCIAAPEGKLLDIGSGAGFPGIPLKIILKSLNVYLLDSSRKRASFLKHVCRCLKLDGIHVVNSRVEELVKNHHYLNTFDGVISRAAFKLPELLSMSAPFLTGGGTLIAMKGKDIAHELTESREAAKTSGMIFSGLHDLKLPVTKDNRKIVIYKRDLS
ncbi:MAG: 16S rRNA (guanine(527)-N(7))-methyltransferase RsmG [Deltaproteobacteria bacterium]|nr:16S rRNA (guanine(527)-N(7))-methyltransferase RsmG [Deltaproteobacteria bacterium]